jgi:ornithine carbamoyltransferase
MSVNLKGRNFLTLKDFLPDEIDHLLALSLKLKQDKMSGIRSRNLEGKNIALIFEKPSTRTRCAFVVACNDEGAHAEYLGKNDIQLAKKESVKDTARVLGRMFDGIQFRGFSHRTAEELAAFAGVPVWNGLTDKFHPTQVLADFMTVTECLGGLKGIKMAYVGDGSNNVANSLMIGGAKMGLDFRIVTHESLFPDPGLLAEVREMAPAGGARITCTSNIDEGVDGIDVIYTDVWASMGDEERLPERIGMLKQYQVNEKMIERTGNPNVIFLHCLPSFHGRDTEISARFPDVCEVTDEVFEHPRSKVFDQAENRVHTIKAVMVATIGK